MIQHPVHQLANEEAEYCYVADATGRELTIEEIVEALNALPPEEAAHPDKARLDYLERELSFEAKYLRDCTREDRPLSLFRRNVPITRAAIDEAMGSNMNVYESKEKP